MTRIGAERQLDGAGWVARASGFLLRNSKLLRAFRGDSLLAGLTLLLVIGGLLPLFVCRFIPLADLPGNAGAASLLFDAAFGHGAAAKYYVVNYAPTPYWTAYLFMASVSSVFDVLVAAKAIVGLLVVLLPLVTMRLLIALRRDPRLGLWAFALSWEHNLYFGWVTYLLGMSLALLATAWIIELEKPRDALRVFVLSVLVALSHIQAVAFLGLAVLLLLVISRPFVRSAVNICLGASGALVPILPWLAAHLKPGAGGKKAGPSFSFELHTPSEKLHKFAEYCLDNVPTPSAQWVMAGVFLLLLLGPAFLAGLPQRQPVLPARRGAWVVAVTACALYFALPMSVHGPIGHWYTYPRYAPFLLLGLLLLARPRIEKKFAWALLPGVFAALSANAIVTAQMASFGRDVAPLQRIIDNIRPNSTILPLTINEWHPLFTGFYPFGQVHAYVAGMTRSFDPLFFDYASVPLLFNPDTRLPNPSWDRPFDYSYEKHGQFYDYILVQGTKGDPVREGPTKRGQTIRRVVQSGIWTLYAVEPKP